MRATNVLRRCFTSFKWDLGQYLVPDQREKPHLIEPRLTSVSEFLHGKASNFLGYQVNADVLHSNDLQKFMNIHINNVGDPSEQGTFLMNTKEIEYAVIRYYAGLWNVTMRDIQKDNNLQLQDPEAYWGYVLSMGSSEGNIMATWMGRDYVGGKYLIVDKHHSRTVSRQGKLLKTFRTKVEKGNSESDVLLPTVFFTSSAAHYSVLKAAVLMNVSSFADLGNELYPDAVIPGIKKANERFPSHVPVYNNFDGRIDPEKLATLVDFFASRKHGIMVVLNYGTTFTGAYDEVESCTTKLRAIFKRYGLDKVEREITDPDGNKITHVRTGYWIHVDGALGGAYLPYLANFYKNTPNKVVDTVIDENGKVVDYKASDIPTIDMNSHPEVCSTVMSGHKYPGAPWPCGVYMSRHKYQLHPPSSPMYIGSLDSTLSGSRNAISPIVLWKHLCTNSEKSIEENTALCLTTAQQF